MQLELLKSREKLNRILGDYWKRKKNTYLESLNILEETNMQRKQDLETIFEDSSKGI